MRLCFRDMYEAHKLNAQVKVQVRAQENTPLQVQVPSNLSTQVKVLEWKYSILKSVEFGSN